MNNAAITTQPSDAELLTRIGIAFSLQQRSELRRIRYEVQQGVVTLAGTVGAYYVRQLAISALQRVWGVREIRDELNVVPPSTNETFESFTKHPFIHIVHGGNNSSRVLRKSVRYIAGLIAFVALGACLSGCAKQASMELAAVEGIITYGGQPLPHAFVVLHPKANTGAKPIPARGITNTQGVFNATSAGEHAGVPTGDYLVTVQYYPSQQGAIGANVLSPQIASTRTTDIEVRVSAGTNKLTPIEVKR